MDDILNNISEKLGLRIQMIRSAKKITQEELANRIGKSPNFISDIERGKKNPSIKTFLKIIISLDTTPNEVFCDFITTENSIISNTNKILVEFSEIDKQYIYHSVVEYKKILDLKK